MGRDTLRLLEDEHLRLGQAEADGKMMPSIGAIRYLIKLMIQQQKEINQLKGDCKQCEETS